MNLPFASLHCTGLDVDALAAAEVLVDDVGAADAETASARAPEAIKIERSISLSFEPALKGLVYNLKLAGGGKQAAAAPFAAAVPARLTMTHDVRRFGICL